jgi:hypothetical protein
VEQKNSKKLSDNYKRFSGKDLAIPRKGFSNTLRNYLRVGPTSYEPIAVNVRSIISGSFAATPGGKMGRLKRPEYWTAG